MPKSLFIEDNPEEKEVSKRKFKRENLNLNYTDGGRYLGSYWDPREEIEEWMLPKVEAWSHRVLNLDKTAMQYPQLAYAGLEMSLQLECKYLQRTFPTIESARG